jgi:hypothetical protein
VYCGRRLTVDGEGLTGDTKGCVLGGRIVAMEGMEIASAGSDAIVTRLYSGVNPDVLELIQSIRARISSLNKKATRIRMKIGIDLHSPKAMERLRLMPNKEAVKALLLDLKEVSREQGLFSSKLKVLEPRTYAQTPEVCTIAVKKQVVPIVIVTIAEAVKTINHKENAIVARYSPIDGVVI